MVRRTSATLTLPVAARSLALSTCTALAPSFCEVRIFEPVTTTRARSSAA
jgi:hypothetical protein